MIQGEVMEASRGVAIVTGGTSAIGEATVRLFAREGAKVALMARREEEGKRATASNRGTLDRPWELWKKEALRRK